MPTVKNADKSPPLPLPHASTRCEPASFIADTMAHETNALSGWVLTTAPQQRQAAKCQQRSVGSVPHSLRKSEKADSYRCVASCFTSLSSSLPEPVPLLASQEKRRGRERAMELLAGIGAYSSYTQNEKARSARYASRGGLARALCTRAQTADLVYLIETRSVCVARRRSHGERIWRNFRGGHNRNLEHSVGRGDFFSCPRRSTVTS
jgi:hypothetical protein